MTVSAPSGQWVAWLSPSGRRSKRHWQPDPPSRILACGEVFPHPVFGHRETPNHDGICKRCERKDAEN